MSGQRVGRVTSSAFPRTHVRPWRYHPDPILAAVHAGDQEPPAGQTSARLGPPTGAARPLPVFGRNGEQPGTLSGGGLPTSNNALRYLQDIAEADKRLTKRCLVEAELLEDKLRTTTEKMEELERSIRGTQRDLEKSLHSHAELARQDEYAQNRVRQLEDERRRSLAAVLARPRDKGEMSEEAMFLEESVAEGVGDVSGGVS